MLNEIDPEFRDLIGYPVPAPTPEPGALKLAPRLEKLASLLAAGKSKLDAAKECGWQSAGPCSRPEVAERAAYLAGEMWKAEHMGPDELLASVAAVVRFDPARLADERGDPLRIDKIDVMTRRALQGVEFEEINGKDGEVTRRVKFKAASKDAAQDKLMRRFGLYERDNAQVSGNKTLIQLLSVVQEESRGVGDLLAGNEA